LPLIIAVAGFFLHRIELAAVIALALAALGYFLFQAPVWCGAEARKSETYLRRSQAASRTMMLVTERRSRFHDE
jgi:hypothetical protein